MTEPELLSVIQACVEAAGSLRKSAKTIGISHAYLYDIIQGRRSISPKVAKFFGYRKEKECVTRFVKIRKS